MAIMPFMKYFLVQALLLSISVAAVFTQEENSTVILNSTDDDDLNQSENYEKTFNSPASDNTSDNIGMPKTTNPKSHHHSKQKDRIDNQHSHRSPVYEVVSQPCASFGCRNYERGGYKPWQSKGNRFVPYPQSVYEPRRRGPYSQDFYPDGYYGPRDQDYGYGGPRMDQGGPRGYPPMRGGRYGGGYGGYSQPFYGDQFMG